MLCPNWGFRPCAGTGPGVDAERVASAAAIAITGGGGHKAVEHDQDGRLLCPAALWGKPCRYFQSGTCKFSHAVPAALAAGYAARRTQQRAWEEARRADARAAAKRVVPPPPQSDAVEAARKERVLESDAAVAATGLVDLVRGLLECPDGETLEHLHQRGPALAPKARRVAQPAAGGCPPALPPAPPHPRTGAAAGAAAVQRPPPPLPLYPMLIPAFKLGGFKLPAAWSKDSRYTKQLIKKMHAHPAYKAFLAGYDQFVHDVILPTVADSKGIYYQRPPSIRVVMPSRKASMDVRRDADFPGHHPAEISFWVALTEVGPPSALWLETSPGAGNYRPVLLGSGQALRYNGNLCRHHTVPNTSGLTRVSLDLRVIPASAAAAGVERIGVYDAAFMAAPSGAGSARSAAGSKPGGTKPAILLPSEITRRKVQLQRLRAGAGHDDGQR